MRIRLQKGDLFFLKKVGPKSKSPERDYLTQGLLNIINHPDTVKVVDKGFVSCVGCGFKTANCYFQLRTGQILHALGVHYLMWHRNDLLLQDIGKVVFHMSKYFKDAPPKVIKPDKEMACWEFDGCVYVEPKTKTEHTGTLLVRYSPDGVILDFRDQNGAVIATNGLDLDTLCRALRPN